MNFHIDFLKIKHNLQINAEIGQGGFMNKPIHTLQSLVTVYPPFQNDEGKISK